MDEEAEHPFAGTLERRVYISYSRTFGGGKHEG